MFRFGAEKVAETTKTFSYSLLSLWPVNRQNAPRTAAEKKGLNTSPITSARTSTPTKRSAAVDISPPCMRTLRSRRPASVATTTIRKPRGEDFKLNDVMGGVVIRLPM